MDNQDPTYNEAGNTSSQTNSTISTPSKKDRFWAIAKKMNYKWLIPILLLIIVILVQRNSNNKIVTAHNKELIELKKEHQTELKSKLLDNSQKQLTLMMKSLVWAVRSAMIRKNNDEIAQYFYEMVQEDNIQEVVLIDNSNTIKVSTNKKNELKKFSTLYPDANLNVHAITFSVMDEDFQLIAPILSLDKKIGTLFIQIDNEFHIDSSTISTIDTLSN